MADAVEVAGWEEAIELYHRNGWTDGLPIVPPTEERVVRLAEFAGRSLGEEIGFYEVRNRPVTVEKVAINAVMAGCLPEHFPVVLTLVECVLTPGFEVHTANSSTGSVALGFIVNGPVRHALGMNSHGNVLGPGNRANASIGRALRLVQLNVMGSVGGAGGPAAHGRPVLDRSTMGQPAKYTGYHIVEDEETFPQLEPLHVRRGFAGNDSVVTAFSVAGHVMLSNHAEKTPDEWVDTVAHYLIGAGRLAPHGYGILLLPPEAAGMFVDAGWSKDAIATALHERTSRTVAWVKRNGWKIHGRFERGGPVLPGDDDEVIGIAAAPDDIHIVVCGGPAGNFPIFLQPYAATYEVVSRRVPFEYHAP